VAAFVAEITASYGIHDLTVEHPPIEETVAELYQRHAGGAGLDADASASVKTDG
jgi:hypothetical protein